MCISATQLHKQIEQRSVAELLERSPCLQLEIVVLSVSATNQSVKQVITARLSNRCDCHLVSEMFLLINIKENMIVHYKDSACKSKIWHKIRIENSRR